MTTTPISHTILATLVTTFTVSSESSNDWQGRQWTIPFNAGVSQLLKLGGQPVSIGLMGTRYVAAPAGAPDWGIRLAFTFQFPKSQPF
ncbi:MAG: hypothetical protein NTW21_30010 [Verrucomicrobia bacterium]|nr:hypothetical protein [Verrucomicrobiota bacterium]